MINPRVGVRRQSTRFEPNKELWNLFGELGEAGVIPSKRVPLADSFGTLDVVPSAIGGTRGKKDDIVESVDASPRHADLYAITGWILGFVHQEQPDEEPHRQRC